MLVALQQLGCRLPYSKRTNHELQLKRATQHMAQLRCQAENEQFRVEARQAARNAERHVDGQVSQYL